jgi:hypothetical protein
MVKKITKGKVFEFVKKELVPAKRKDKAVCGDDRYEREQSKDGTRIFGADMGVLMAEETTLKDEGQHITPEALVAAYAQVKKDLYGEEAELDYHCDAHNHEKGEFGCGHIKHAANPDNNGKYGSITAEDVQSLFEALSQHPSSRLTILNGGHNAHGVIFVHTPNPEAEFALNSKNKKGQAFFVVHKERADRYFDEITPKLSQKLGVSIDPEAVKRNYWLQVGATTVLLEADKLPHFDVIVNAQRDFTMEQLPKQRTQASI